MTIGWRERLLIVCLLVSILWSAADSAESQSRSSSFTFMQVQTDGWVIEYRPPSFHFTTVDVEGRPHILFDVGEQSEGSLQGVPQLPVEALSIGIPFDVSLSLELVDPQYETVDNQLIAPIPEYRYTEEKEAVAVYRKDRSVYSTNTFLPTQLFEPARQFTLREQRVASVRFHPYQYNPSTKTLRRLLKGQIVLHFSPSKGMQSNVSGAGIRVDDPHFENVYRSLLWNYEQAKQWRRPIGRALPHSNDPTRDWFEPGRKYYRVPIAEDGWYRVTRQQLIAAGAEPLFIDPSTIKAFFKGIEIPSMVRADTSIEFYAMHNYGDSTYTDFYTDTSAYWITWGGTQGRHFSVVPQVADTLGIAEMKTAEFTAHYETNTQFYNGATQADIIQQGPLPGKGWFWDSYYPGSVISHQFSIDSLDAGGTATLRVQLFGMTSNQIAPVRHRARFSINGDSLADFSFDQRTGPLLSVTFPAARLKKGDNVLEIQSIDTGTNPNQFYLDWFEVIYPRYFRAIGNQLEFVTPSFSISRPAAFSISGFSLPTIEVFDLTGNRLITGGAVNGGPIVGYTVTFRDTISTPKVFLVVCAGGQKVVSSVVQKVFTDIRKNPAGADYIVLTHRNFMTAARQLAAQRSSFDGVRTAVIDVQDIYDEFNYGIFNATKIKVFLRYAYQNWTAPAPVYVLMFGGASWDFHRYLSSTIKSNYVPAYGIPAGDNWFGCFDSTLTFLPSLLIGRIPVEDSVQAFRTVSKIKGYDGYSLGEWNKNFMFITGGIGTGEQAGFNNLTEPMMTQYVLSPPVGGTTFPVFKASDDVINGDKKELMKSLFRSGLVFVNFLGHAAGKIWNVDIGDPNDLENTNGKLPFISSVSCNVAAFAEPSMTVLAEDFVLADNRGAIGMWGSSSLGYAYSGTRLVNHFLASLTRDTTRDLGSLTTAARIKLWQESGTDYITIAEVNLNPLLGDPLSKMALSLKPDLDISSGDISLNTPAPTPSDSSFTIRVHLRNLGLVPPDSVAVSVTDLYQGKTSVVLSNKKIARTLHYDSLSVPWDATSQVGRHLLTVSLDPNSTLDEVSKSNNVASSDQYIYANSLAVVKPIDNQVVAPGAQRLVVTSPLGLDSLGFRYYFEIDTTDTFDSPAKDTSGAVLPGPVSGEWVTQVLPSGKVYFWRVRTMYGAVEGNWVTSSFATSTDLPDSLSIRWRQRDRRQFSRNRNSQVSLKSNGVTIGQTEPVTVLARSLGYNHRWLEDYYSIIQVNEKTVRGYWWVIGSSFLAVRLDEFTGDFVVRGFDLLSQPAQADSMKNFIQNTPRGNYLAIIVIFDGKTNVTDSLYAALESLGSTKIRLYSSGQTWAFIARKGYSSTVVESVSNDSAIVTMQVPNFYSYGSGSTTTQSITIPTAWKSLHWRSNGVRGSTDMRVAVLGMKPATGIDTLRILQADSSDLNLDFLNQITSGPKYLAIRFAALLTTSDPLVTPVFRDWWVDFEAPGDLAVSRQTIGMPEMNVQRGKGVILPVSVYNLGFRGADSARILVSMYDKYNKARPIASAEIGHIPIDGLAGASIPLSTTNFSRRVTLQVSVSPAKNVKDLVLENNEAYYTFAVSGSQGLDVQLFADGVQLMNGDYVSSRPKLLVRLPKTDEQDASVQRLELLVDRNSVASTASRQDNRKEFDKAPRPDEFEVTPVLSNGRHDLTIRLAQVNSFGDIDTLEHTVNVNVMSEARILQCYNFPNPFSRDTYFTFVITGDRPPEELHIRIFTVAGRKVKEIRVPQPELQIGFNRIYWDGRDADGDELANGYYLYQVSFTSQGKTESRIDKLAKVR